MGSVIDEDQLPAGHLCELFQSALGRIDIEHWRVSRTGIWARDKD